MTLIRPLFIYLQLLILALAIPSTGNLGAQESTDKVTQAAIDEAATRGIEFLRQRGQGENGAFSPETGAAVTGR